MLAVMRNAKPGTNGWPSTRRKKKRKMHTATAIQMLVRLQETSYIELQSATIQGRRWAKDDEGS
jgi:hypothetical protein